MPKLPLPGSNDPACPDCGHKLPCPYAAEHEKAKKLSEPRTRSGGRPRAGETRQEARDRRGLKGKSRQDGGKQERKKRK